MLMINVIDKMISDDDDKDKDGGVDYEISNSSSLF